MAERPGGARRSSVSSSHRLAMSFLQDPSMPQDVSAATRRDATRTVSLVVLSQVAHFLTFGGIALLLPLIRADLEISFAQAGLLSAAATLSYALAQIPAGYLSDRYGPKRLFALGLMGWSVLSLALAFVSAYWLALLTLFMAGAFRALLFAPGLALLSSWFPRERRATAMSLFLVGAFVGTLILSLAGPAMSAYAGWRPTFALFALVGIAAALAFSRLARDRPRARAVDRIALRDALAVLKHPVVWLCNALQFVRFSVATSFNFWLPTLLIADRGLTLQSAGLVVAMTAALSAPANALGGYVSDRLSNPPLVIGGSLAVLACTCALLVTVDSLAVALVVIAVNSLFIQFYFGPLFLVPVEVLGQRRAGLVTGVGNLFANLGALGAAWLLGVVKDASGSFTWGFLGIAVLCAAGVVLSVVLACVRKRALRTSPPTGAAPSPTSMRYAAGAARGGS